MSKKGIFAIGILLIALAAMAQYTFGLVGVGAHDLRLENTGRYISYAIDSSPSFHSSNSRSFFVTTRTGIRHVASSGDIRVNETFSLTRPHMVARGDVVAVGEEDGRVIRTFNANGSINVVPLDNPAQGFFVNANGVVSVIMASDSGYHIKAFDRYVSDEYFFRSNIQHRDNPMRFPIAVDVSENRQYVAIAHLNLYHQMVASIDFFAADRSARFGTVDIFAGIHFPGEILIAMRFVSDNQMLVITDSQITILRIDGNALQEEWSHPLYNRLDQLAFCVGGHFAYVSGTPVRPNCRYADPVGTVNIFNINGLTGRFYLGLGRRATHLSMGHNAVIVGVDRYFHAVNARGVSLWHHSVQQDVRDMIFLDDTNTILIAGATRAEVWRRQRTRDE